VRRPKWEALGVGEQGTAKIREQKKGLTYRFLDVMRLATLLCTVYT
jgi:hypothetical protein